MYCYIYVLKRTLILFFTYILLKLSIIIYYNKIGNTSSNRSHKNVQFISFHFIYQIILFYYKNVRECLLKYFLFHWNILFRSVFFYTSLI